MPEEIETLQIAGLIMFTALLGIMGYVYLNRDKYAKETDESRRILRFFASLCGGVAASGLINGQISLGGGVHGLPVTAGGGIAFAVLIWVGWSKYDTGLNAEIAADMIEQGIESRLGKEISEAVLATEADQFANQIYQKDLAQAMSQLAEDVKQGNAEACKTIIQLNLRKDPALLLAYFEKKR